LSRTGESAPATRLVDRPRAVLAILLVAGTASVFHYVDNYVRFEQYPQPEPKLITQGLVWQGWLIFTAFGVAGYLLYLRGGRAAAGACLAVYSVSGLIGWLHYTGGPISAFDAFQHANIVIDGLAGIAVLVLAVAVARSGEATSSRRGASLGDKSVDVAGTSSGWNAKGGRA
jgi:hypothetical protein